MLIKTLSSCIHYWINNAVIKSNLIKTLLLPFSFCLFVKVSLNLNNPRLLCRDLLGVWRHLEKTFSQYFLGEHVCSRTASLQHPFSSHVGGFLESHQKVPARISGYDPFSAAIWSSENLHFFKYTSRKVPIFPSSYVIYPNSDLIRKPVTIANKMRYES